MVKVYDFPAVRPTRDAAPAIAAVPYDVVTAAEARAAIEKNAFSFLRVSRPDAELPGIPPSDDRVYERARQNFNDLVSRGLMAQDATPSLYLYEVVQDGVEYLGLACCLDVDDYRTNRIRRHEQTRYDKEEDRTRHIEATQTHNGPVVLLCRDNGDIYPCIKSLVSDNAVPDAEVRTGSGSVHRIFRISDAKKIQEIRERFDRIPFLYIADGHHRAKSAVNVADRHGRGDPSAGINRFLGVIFSHNRVRIHGYSRLLTDIGSYTAASFLEGLRKHFTVTEYRNVDGTGYQIRPKIPRPEQYHIFHVYIGGRWYECTRKADPAGSVLQSLDVAILQEFVCKGMLDITDPRGDPRLQYLGGARPVSDLTRLVDSGEYVLAIAMQPVRVETVLDIADAGGIMPPKSTWFEPKLLSGLLVHTFD